jgi:hypothetical protein
VSFVNSTAKSLFGHKAEELVGELFGFPIVPGESVEVDIIRKGGEIDGDLRRGIAVTKMRGSQYDKEIREFTIDNGEVHIGKPFRNVQNILLGIPSSSAPSELCFGALRCMERYSMA